MKHNLVTATALVIGFFLSAAFPSLGFAQAEASSSRCGERLRAAIMTTKVKLPINRSLYQLAGVALRHYRTEITTGDIFIEEAAEYRDRNGTTTGYKISITDGGDESLVDYILDGDRKLISAYWHNQSPLRFWFCH